MMANVNGTRIAYTDEGRGFPLIFLHGFPYSRDVWSKQVEAFKPRFRVIAPDLRGYGESEVTFGPSSLQNLSRDLHALLDHLVTEPVVLAGQALGGLVALAFAHAFPRLVRGLVLVGMKTGQNSHLGHPASKAAGGAPTGIEAVSEDARNLRWNDEAFWGLSAEATRVEPAGVEQLLETLRVPTLVIAGSEDPSITSGESLAMARPIRGAQFNLIPHAGQLVALEQAEAFNQIVMNWLAWGSRELNPPDPDRKPG